MAATPPHSMIQNDAVYISLQLPADGLFYDFYLRACNDAIAGFTSPRVGLPAEAMIIILLALPGIAARREILTTRYQRIQITYVDNNSDCFRRWAVNKRGIFSIAKKI